MRKTVAIFKTGGVSSRHYQRQDIKCRFHLISEKAFVRTWAQLGYAAKRLTTQQTVSVMLHLNINLDITWGIVIFVPCTGSREFHPKRN